MIVKGERLKRAILLALAETELQKIMDAAVYESKSVSQIMEESDVSHSTAYRKIRWLVEEKLLIVDKIEITENGRKASLFRTTLKSFNIKYEHNNLLIEAEQNFDTLRQITENFFILPDPGSPHVSI
jgi:DNA-binding transcriptional ArsR family regulator